MTPFLLYSFQNTFSVANGGNNGTHGDAIVDTPLGVRSSQLGSDAQTVDDEPSDKALPKVILFPEITEVGQTKITSESAQVPSPVESMKQVSIVAGNSNEHSVASNHVKKTHSDMPSKDSPKIMVQVNGHSYSDSLLHQLEVATTKNHVLQGQLRDIEELVNRNFGSSTERSRLIATKMNRCVIYNFY
jgi:hypothetical protein